MTLEELKAKRIKNLESVSEFLYSSRQLGVFFIPDTISIIVSDMVKQAKPSSGIVLNSNLGEISSKLGTIKNLISIDINILTMPKFPNI